MFRDVPECSGMFRHVPECSMFRVLSTAKNPSVDVFEDGIEKTSSVLNSVIYCKVISCSCDFYPQRNFYNHGAIKRRTRPFCKLGISSQEEIRLEIEVNL